MLHFAALHSGSSIRYKINLFENYFLKYYEVKIILISFNCFSENTLNFLLTGMFIGWSTFTVVKIFNSMQNSERKIVKNVLSKTARG